MSFLKNPKKKNMSIVTTTSETLFKSLKNVTDRLEYVISIGKGLIEYWERFYEDRDFIDNPKNIEFQIFVDQFDERVGDENCRKEKKIKCLQRLVEELKKMLLLHSPTARLLSDDDWAMEGMIREEKEKREIQATEQAGESFGNLNIARVLKREMLEKIETAIRNARMKARKLMTN